MTRDVICGLWVSLLISFCAVILHFMAVVALTVDGREESSVNRVKVSLIMHSSQRIL